MRSNVHRNIPNAIPSGPITTPVTADVDKIESGILPAYRHPDIIKPDEITHFACPAIRYITDNRFLGYAGNSTGTRYRVTNGVSFQTGGYNRMSVRGDVTDSFQGEFILTNKRIIFIHGQHGFECTLNTIDIIHDEGNNKVLIQKGRTTCILHLAAYIYQQDAAVRTGIIENASELLLKAIRLIQNGGARVGASSEE